MVPAQRNTAPIPESRVGQRVAPPPSQAAPKPAEKRGWFDSFKADRSVQEAPANRDELFGTLMVQASQLEIVDVRDDAYLSILDYALAEDRVQVAEVVLARLSAPPLRDTARQRIGLAHARAGRTQEAFAVLEGLEIPELEDPIRLEIIRAVTHVD